MVLRVIRTESHYTDINWKLNGVIKMRTSFSIISVLLMGMMVTGVGAFEMGENCIQNGDFEIGELGVIPEGWELKVTG